MDRKILIKTLKKSMRLKVIILLGIMLTFNTLAWFIYSNTVSNSIETSVKAWKIEFEGEDSVAQYIEFNIDDLYPGMPNYNNTINIVNYGETGADLSYKIIRLKVLDDLYTEETHTSDELETILSDNFPFKITFSLSREYLNPNNDSADFYVTVNWPYESENDELDTQWGHDSYSFKLANLAAKQIQINIKLLASQVN